MLSESVARKLLSHYKNLISFTYNQIDDPKEIYKSLYYLEVTSLKNTLVNLESNGWLPFVSKLKLPKGTYVVLIKEHKAFLNLLEEYQSCIHSGDAEHARHTAVKISAKYDELSAFIASLIETEQVAYI